MKEGVKCEHSYSPVLHASGFRTMLALATAEDMLTNHVDINRAFLQDDVLEEEGFESDVYISPPPGYGEDAKYVYCLCAPLYGVRHAIKPCQLWWSGKLQDSRLRKIHVVPPRCKRKDHGGQSYWRFLKNEQTAFASTNSDSRCSTLPRADSKAHTKDLCTTIWDAPSHVTSTLAPLPSCKLTTLNARAKSMDNVSWISSKTELEISFIKTRLEKWVWESVPKIDPATGVRLRSVVIVHRLI